MELTIATNDLVKRLDDNSDLVYNEKVSGNNFNSIFAVLKKTKINILNIIDVTSSMSLPNKSIIQVKDHINKTGNNPLIGNQKLLGIDFIDITNIYDYNHNAVITTCCGSELNKNEKYPSYFLCHVAIIAKALNIKKIRAYLYNINNI